MNVFSDFYSRLQSAQRAGLPCVGLPWSHKIYRFGLLLKRLKYIEDLECIDNSEKKSCTIWFYLKPGSFSYLRQISKPSLRVYKKAKEIHPYKKAYGSLILSTSKGLLSCQEAQALGLGGELMCEIY